jgi:hypothetical protein
MTPLEIFRLVATEFKDVDDAEVEKWVELSKPFVSKKKFGNTYNHALAYLAAHKLKMAGYGDNTMGKVDDALRVSSFSEMRLSASLYRRQTIWLSMRNTL